MRGFVRFAGGLLLLGCGQGSAARARATDSTTVVLPATQIDTSSNAPANTEMKALTKAPTKTSTKAPPSPLTGYDSAFGPTFTVDSTGKVTPIAKKKP